MIGFSTLASIFAVITFVTGKTSLAEFRNSDHKNTGNVAGTSPTSTAKPATSASTRPSTPPRTTPPNRLRIKLTMKPDGHVKGNEYRGTVGWTFSVYLDGKKLDGESDCQIHEAMYSGSENFFAGDKPYGCDVIGSTWGDAKHPVPPGSYRLKLDVTTKKGLHAHAEHTFTILK